MPLGMIVVRDEFFLTVSLRKNKIIESFEKRKIKNFQTYKKTLLEVNYNIDKAIEDAYLVGRKKGRRN